MIGGMICPLFQTVGYAQIEDVSGKYITHTSGDGNNFGFINFNLGDFVSADEKTFASSTTDTTFNAICCAFQWNHDGQGQKL